MTRVRGQREKAKPGQVKFWALTWKWDQCVFLASSCSVLPAQSDTGVQELCTADGSSADAMPACHQTWSPTDTNAHTHTFYFLYKKYFNYLSRMIYPEIRMFSCWKHGDIFTSVFKFFLFTIIAKSTQLFVKKYFMHKIKILLGKTSATHSIQDISSQYLSLQSGKTSTKLLKTILPSLLMSQ